jgi:enterochelin esterase-like enzyme
LAAAATEEATQESARPPFDDLGVLVELKPAMGGIRSDRWRREGAARDRGTEAVAAGSGAHSAWTPAAARVRTAPVGPLSSIVQAYANRRARREAAGRAAPICGVALVVAALGPGSPAADDLAGGCPHASHRIESLALFAPALERAKRIEVYLPPGYRCATGRRYPVVYLNDGQDLFEDVPPAPDLEPAVARDIAAREAWYGSWRLDRQLDRAIAEGRLPPLIAVGIASDDGLRSRDLAPVPWDGSSEGRGEAYGGFVADAVVPAIDGRFRTIAEPGCRGIGGASLGGVSALQIGLAHGDRFGLVLALSPLIGERALADYLATAWADAARPAASWLIDFDDDPLGAADRARFAAWIGARADAGVMLIQSAGSRHAIGSWAERVVPALVRLFGAACRG